LGQLNPLSFSDVRRKLTSAGFSEISQVGSHVKFAKVDGGVLRTAIVPKHREIAIGTLRSILRQSGISTEEWDRL
jgi:predicted RNA binding protein YcfA (HicA-like mRNA interferase family)